MKLCWLAKEFIYLIHLMYILSANIICLSYLSIGQSLSHYQANYIYIKYGYLCIFVGCDIT